jgi:hypothetical protein
MSFSRVLRGFEPACAGGDFAGPVRFANTPITCRDRRGYCIEVPIHFLATEAAMSARLRLLRPAANLDYSSVYNPWLSGVRVTATPSGCPLDFPKDLFPDEVSFGQTLSLRVLRFSANCL